MVRKMSEAINGKVHRLASTHGLRVSPMPLDPSLPDAARRRIAYGKELDAIRKAAGNNLYTGLNPVSQDTMLWLENRMPGVRGLEAFRLLSRPSPTIAHVIHGFREGTRSESLPDRMQGADKAVNTTGGCLVLLTLVCLFVPPVFLLPGGFAVWCMVVTQRRIRARKRVRTICNTLWSVDTWLRQPPATSNATVAQLRPPPLPVGRQAGGLAKSSGLSLLLIVLVVFGSILFLLVAIGAFLGPSDHVPTPGKKPASADARVATNVTVPAKSTPEVRRSVFVHVGDASSSSDPASDATEGSYTVVGVPSGDTLNVRAGPGVNNSVIARLPNGANHIAVTGTSVMNGSTEWVPIRAGIGLGG